MAVFQRARSEEQREARRRAILGAATGMLARDLAGALDRTAPAAARSGQLAGAVAASLAARPMLCDLISAQAAVLEHNVSPQVAAPYKRGSMSGIAALGDLMLRGL